MNKEQRLKKRHNAEKRFKLYGLTSILLAIFFVIFLLNAIFSKGSGAFLKTTIDVEVNFDADTLELSESPPLEDLENTDYYELAIDSILKVKKVNGLTEEKLFPSAYGGGRSPFHCFCLRVLRTYAVGTSSLGRATSEAKSTAPTYCIGCPSVLEKP